MPYEFKFIKRVEFAETDMAGIMHFSNYFRYMEMAEHAFFRSLDLSIHAAFDDIHVGWPRVHAEADFIEPLRFEDEVEIHLLVVEKKQKTLSYRFIFRKLIAGVPDVVCAYGNSTTVCVGIDEKCRIAGSMPIPSLIAEKIQSAPFILIQEGQFNDG